MFSRHMLQDILSLSMRPRGIPFNTSLIDSSNCSVVKIYWSSLVCLWSSSIHSYLYDWKYVVHK